MKPIRDMTDDDWIDLAWNVVVVYAALSILVTIAITISIILWA